VANPKNLPAIFFIPYERAILLVKCDFSYSCAAADKISTNLRRRAVPLLSYLLTKLSFEKGLHNELFDELLKKNAFTRFVHVYILHNGAASRALLHDG